MDTPAESSLPAADAPKDRVEMTVRSGTGIVSVIGDYDLSHEDELRTALERAATECGRVVVDLSRCSLLDSTGIALLINAPMRAMGAAGRLRLVVPPGGAVARVADLIRLGDIVPISETLDAQPA